MFFSFRLKAYTLLELLFVITIIATLVALSFPAFHSVNKTLNRLRAIENAKRIYMGASEFIESLNLPESEARQSLSTDMNWWKQKLKSHGVTPSMWHVPGEASDPEAPSDYFYAGATPYDFLNASDKDQIYLFVQKQPTFGGNIVIMADGTVKIEYFFE